MCTSQLAFLQVVTACQIETRPMFAATLDLMRWDCDSACTAFCTTACLTALVCPPDRRAVHSQAVRWARNSRHLVAMVRQCSAEAELALSQPQAQVRMPHLFAHSLTPSSTRTNEDCTGCQAETPRLLHQHRHMK